MPLLILNTLIAYPFLRHVHRFYTAYWLGSNSYDAAPSLHHKRVVTPDGCGFYGDADTYGLGIRLGIYLQWASSMLAYAFVNEEAGGMRRVNNGFQLGILSGLVFLTVTKGRDLYVGEAYVILQFCWGGFYAAIFGGPSLVSKQKSVVSELGQYCRLLLLCGFFSYSVWFWFVGMDEMRKGNCGDYGFFLARVNLFNWFKVFNKIAMVSTCISLYMSFIYATYVLGREVMRHCGHGGSGEGQGDESDITCGEVGQLLGQLLGQLAMDACGRKTFEVAKRILISYILLSSLIANILLLELTIRWNKIRGVNEIRSTGQLIPIIIGGGGFGYLVVKIIENGMSKVTKGKHGPRTIATNEVQNDENEAGGKTDKQPGLSEDVEGGGAMEKEEEGLHSAGLGLKS